MVKKFFPFLNWFEGYNLEGFRIDAIAGLTVALVLIPQSMAYAQLAGMPPYYGLYASFLPPMMAALFGSSRQLATGPVAVVSLMTSASLEPLATAGSEGYIAYAILLALMVGVFQFSLGILKLGIIVNFLSHPVVNGFTNAAAIIIASSQLSKLFGVYVDKAEHHYETIINVCKAAIHYTHWPTLFLGVLAFLIMYILKKFTPKIPNVLVAVVVTTLISWSIGFQNNQFVTLNEIESIETKKLMTEFNTAVITSNSLSDKKIQRSNAFDLAKKNHNKIEMLNTQHNMDVLSVKIKNFKHIAHTNRERLRSFMFEKKTLDNGTFKFLLKKKSEIKGNIWRIKIGNTTLNTEKLLMTGGGAVVGVVPKGVPSLTIPKINLKIILQLFPFAAIISLLGFMEAISIAKAMAAKTGQRLDPNQELVGQGLANILGSFGKSYPTSGSFSRSAVNLQAGAVSGLSSVCTSITVVIVLLFFTPLLYHLPQSVLAAVIMMAVIGLINASGFIHAWHAKWYDGAISIISFIFTLIFAPHLDKGIMIGVLLSLTVFLYKSMRPKISFLSRSEEEALICADSNELMLCKYIDLIRFEGSLFFANASFLEDSVNDRLSKKKELKHIIIACNGINDIDASGEEALSLVVSNIRSAGKNISFSGINESVMRVLKRTHLYEKIGEKHIYPTMDKAVIAIHKQVHQETSDKECPLLNVSFLEK